MEHTITLESLQQWLTEDEAVSAFEQPPALYDTTLKYLLWAADHDVRRKTKLCERPPVAQTRLGALYEPEWVRKQAVNLQIYFEEARLEEAGTPRT